ncbi:hypothetical protein D3C71_1821450 [compost metagenome]
MKLAILQRRAAQQSLENALEMGEVIKAGLLRDIDYPQICFRQQLAGFFDAQPN